MKISGYDQAYPLSRPLLEDCNNGMNLRTYIATQVLAASLSGLNGHFPEHAQLSTVTDPETLCRQSVQYADMLIKTLNK